MAWRVYFSFDYRRDLWRANVVRNNPLVEGISAAGFHDVSWWEEGDQAAERRIDHALNASSVTVVLIGTETADLKYVSYEIEKSIERGNGIIGVQIGMIKDRNGDTESVGAIPVGLISIGAPVYTYEYGKLDDWIKEASERAFSRSGNQET